MTNVIQPNATPIPAITLNNDKENPIWLHADIGEGACVALDLTYPHPESIIAEHSLKVFSVTKFLDEGANLELKVHCNPQDDTANPNEIVVLENKGLRPALNVEVINHSAIEDVDGYLERQYQRLVKDPTMILTPVLDENLAPLKRSCGMIKGATPSRKEAIFDFHSRVDKLTPSERNKYMELLDELVVSVDTDYSKSSVDVSNLISQVRHALGTPRMETCTVQLNVLSGLKQILIHVLTRFRLEGHSGMTYRSGARIIIGSLERVSKKYKEANDPDLWDTIRVPVAEILKEELSAYVDKDHPDLTEFEVLKLWRKNGRFATYPVFDFSYFPNCANDTEIDLDRIESLIKVFSYLLADGPSIIGYDITDESLWQKGRHIGGGSRYHTQNIIFPSVFKEVDEDKGTERIYVAGAIVFTNSIQKGLNVSELKNFTNYASGRLVDGSEPDVDPVNFKGINEIQAFQVSPSCEVVIPEKINIFGVAQEELDRILVQSCNPISYYNIKSVSDNGDIVLENHRSKELLTLTKDQFEEIKSVNGKVVQTVSYPAYHTWYKPDGSEK